MVDDPGLRLPRAIASALALNSIACAALFGWVISGAISDIT
jgi:hypothetical protein